MKKRSLAIVLTVALGLSAITGLVSNAELGQEGDPQATPIVTGAPAENETPGAEGTATAIPDANATATPDTNATVTPDASATIAPDVTSAPTQPPVVENETSIVFNRVTIKKGKTVNLKVKLEGAESVKFTTSESKVAKITKRNPKLVKVKGKGLGTAIITAKANGVKSTIRVKVVK